MSTPQPTKCAIWARVSTDDQDTGSQLTVLREWAQRRGFEVVREFITEDSAWTKGNGPKGRAFDRQRADLSRGAHHGDYSRVLIWSLDRLSRRGIKDTIGVLEDLDDAGAIVCSYEQEWLETSDRRMRELVVSVMSWLAELESHNKSAAIRRGMAQRKREGKPVGGRKAGAKDKTARDTSGYKAAWAPGGALRVKREQQLAAKRAARESGTGEDQEL